MTIENIIIGAFIFMIIACVYKKNFVGAGLTLLIGFAVVSLWSDPDYWKMGGKSLLDVAISLLGSIKKSIVNG